jgi:hypothetical protein
MGTKRNQLGTFEYVPQVTSRVQHFIQQSRLASLTAKGPSAGTAPSFRTDWNETPCNDRDGVERRINGHYAFLGCGRAIASGPG